MGSQHFNSERSVGWLATSVGCCAPSLQHGNHYEDLGESHAIGRRASLCHEQPRPVALPRMNTTASTRPSTSHSVSQQLSSWVTSGRDLASRASSRASFSTVARPWTSQSRKRPMISAPSDFRRIDTMPTRRRQSFRPLELSIYMPENRLSPLPDFSLLDWSKKPAELEYPAPAHVPPSRTPSASSTHPSNFRIQRKPVSSIREPSPAAHSRQSSTSTYPVFPAIEPQEPIVRPKSSVARPSSSAQSLRSSFAVSRTPSPRRARSHTEPGPPLNQRRSFRRAKAEIDDAIRELNTIVEERRLSALRSTPSPLPSARAIGADQHIPAIAPSRRMHVREETLSDIGSVFSMPLASKPLPITPKDVTDVESIPEAEWAARLANKEPEEPKRSGEESLLVDEPTTPRPSTRGSARSRLSNWFKRSLPSSPVSSSAPPNFPPPPLPTSFQRSKLHPLQSQPLTPTHSFYQCQDQHFHNRNPSISTFSSIASDTSTVSKLSGAPPSMSFSENTTISPTAPSTPGRARSLEAARKLTTNTIDCDEKKPAWNAPLHDGLGVGVAL